MKKVNLFLTTALFAILTQSCTVDNNGDFHLTWLFWLLIVIILAAVFAPKPKLSDELKKIDAELAEKGLKRTDFYGTRDATYVGGHPDVDRNVPCLIYLIRERSLKFYSRLSAYQMPSFAFEIPVSAIKNIELEDASSIEHKITVGRMLLVGVFAFAWKKKKKNELAFVTIEWNDGRFNHTTILNIDGKEAMQNAKGAFQIVAKK
jgi:hypothetical protein